MTSGLVIKKIYAMLVKSRRQVITGIVKPIIGPLSRIEASEDWKKFLGLDGVEKSVERLLSNDGRLTDQIINYYFEMLETQRIAVHALPSFASSVTSVLPDFEKTFVKEPRDLYLVLAPINISNEHWFLAVLEMKQKTIKIYDSSYGVITKGHKDGSKEISKALKSLAGNQRNWQFQLVSSCPKQSNSHDCGVFMLAFAEYVSRQTKTKIEFDFNQENIRDFRLKFFEQIRSGKVEELKLRNRSDRVLLKVYREASDLFMKYYCQRIVEKRAMYSPPSSHSTQDTDLQSSQNTIVLSPIHSPSSSASGASAHDYAPIYDNQPQSLGSPRDIAQEPVASTSNIDEQQ